MNVVADVNVVVDADADVDVDVDVDEILSPREVRASSSTTTTASTSTSTSTLALLRQLAIGNARLPVMFGFQRLDVYQCAIQFFGLATRLAECVPRGYSSISDQLRRAALSVPLNIAEGSGKTARDAARFYTIARGSALECASIVDVLDTLGTAEAADIEKCRELLERVVSMLTKLRKYQ